jgi:translation initiation factor IF-3
VNERIRTREIRVIDDAGNQLGVKQPFEALKKARESGLDLVEISPSAVPPVCKIMDFGKFRYEQNKQEHEQRKHHKSGQIKEVKFRPTTAEHDYQVRKNRIVKFLEEGYKVKAMVFHRGREMAHPEVSRAKMARLLKEADIVALGQVESTPRMEANILLAVIAPKKGAVPTPAPSTRPATREAESGGSSGQEAKT